ncbi:MAG: bifunctional riboflavin kinase/FAD synthetase [Actinomycetota bacterium]
MVTKMVGLDALTPPAAGSVVTVGTFDGVHLGHRALIAGTIDEAERLGAESIVLTWDRHPAETLRPDHVPPLLSSPARKLELLVATGVGAIAILPFDKELSHMQAKDFVAEVLVRGLGTRSVFVGHDWRFGHRAAGTVPMLAEMGNSLGFDVHGAELQSVAGDVVSSSRARGAVTTGDMELARVLLGRPFDVDGTVVRGAARGQALGYPTANLEVDPSLARPPIGIYAGVARMGEQRVSAAISVGVSPTFGGERGKTPVTIEAYLLDFSEEIYGRTVRLEFWKRLRDEERFDSTEDLVAQMERDVSATRGLTSGR